MEGYTIITKTILRGSVRLGMKQSLMLEIVPFENIFLKIESMWSLRHNIGIHTQLRPNLMFLIYSYLLYILNSFVHVVIIRSYLEYTDYIKKTDNLLHLDGFSVHD